MGTTFTPTQGYLAGIYRSPGLTVSAATVYEMLSNGDFEAGTTGSWVTSGSADGSAPSVAAGYGRESISRGCKLHEGTTGASEIHQSVTWDTPHAAADVTKGYQFIASCWSVHDATGVTGTLRLFLRNPTGTVLASGSVEMTHGHAFYGQTTDNNWSYYSVAVDTVARAQTAEVYIDRSMGATGWLKVDEVSCVMVEQVAGAYGNLAIGEEWQTEDITTFASCGVDGPFRRNAVTMMSPMTVKVDSFYVSDESIAESMTDRTRLFVKLITQKGTKTSDRWEFWALPVGIDWTADVNQIQKQGFTLQVDGLVGVADR